MSGKYSFNTYEQCYRAGRIDFKNHTRRNADRCRDRGAYWDGWHDARRQKESNRPLPEGHHVSAENEKQSTRKGD